MAERIIMPKQGNTVEEVILLEWKKNEGDAVEEGETLCEVETDKATFEVPSTASGVLLKKLFNDGDDVPVMQEFAVVGEAGEEAPAAAATDAASEAAAADAAATEAARDAAATEAARDAAPTEATTAESPAAADVASRPLTGKRDVRISPLARKTAGELGVAEREYARIEGSGPGGRIL